MPKYQFALEDEKDPNVKHNIVVDELAGILGAIADKDGVTKEKAGLRLYNQKYYLARHLPNEDGTKTIYLKKVNYWLNLGTWRSLYLYYI